MASGIYLIENTVNGKVYVGSAFDFDKRIEQHKWMLIKNKHHSLKLQRAWNKYGEESFNIKMIEAVDPSLLIEREQYWLNKYNSSKCGYNICPVAGSRRGSKCSKETKEKIRNNSSSKVGENNNFYGRKHSEETRRKMSLVHYELEFKHSEETKHKIAESKKGKLRSEETKMKVSIARIGQKRSKETNEKIIAKQRGTLWYTNGIESKRCYPGQEPEGYFRGRVTCRTTSLKTFKP